MRLRELRFHGRHTEQPVAHVPALSPLKGLPARAKLSLTRGPDVVSAGCICMFSSDYPGMMSALLVAEVPHELIADGISE